MKYSFELSRHRRANVWLDEEPPGAFTGSSVQTELVKPKRAISATRRMAGVELKVPLRGRLLYALLGAELIEADVDGLEVIVSTANVGAAFPASLAGALDEVKIGLPAGYVRAVVGGVAEFAASVGAPASRRLRFQWAAHGFVSSAPFIFQKVSGIVLRLLMVQTSGADEIRDLLEA